MSARRWCEVHLQYDECVQRASDPATAELLKALRRKFADAEIVTVLERQQAAIEALQKRVDAISNFHEDAKPAQPAAAGFEEWWDSDDSWGTATDEPAEHSARKLAERAWNASAIAERERIARMFPEGVEATIRERDQANDKLRAVRAVLDSEEYEDADSDTLVGAIVTALGKP